MAKPVFSKRAIEDLSGIWNYTADMWGEQQADSYYNAIIEMCRKMTAKSPSIQREYTEIGTGIYGVKVFKHIVFYRISHEDVVEIIRILHERMDLRQHMIFN